MSGFEVIGVILGACPLLISALEGYQKLGRKRDAFKRKSLHIDRMIRALRWQQKLIHSDVRILLRNAGLDETTIDQDVGIGRYQDLLIRQDVRDAVTSFLGENSSTYLEILQQCENTLLRVAIAVKGFGDESWVREDQHLQELVPLTRQVANVSLAGIVHTNQFLDVPGHDRSGHEFWKRVKFSMHKDELEQTIKEIGEYSRLLERVRDKMEQHHPIMVPSSTSNSKAIVSMLQKVQLRASKLYQALAQSWTHACQDSHQARLYLDYRIDSFEASKKPSTSYKQNNIKFSVTLQGCTNPLYRTCVVEVLNINDFQGSNDVRQRTVSFQCRSDAVTPSNGLDVDNMCRILSQTSTRQSLKLYLVESQRLCYEHILHDMSEFPLPHVDGAKMVSLRDLLRDPINRRGLQLKPRVKLAAMVASSAIQLHATPWCRGLRNDSFLFMQDLSGKTDLGNPFIACRFDGKYEPPSASPSQAETELLDLGILILELWHNETMDTFAKDSGLPLQDTFDSRQSVARRWIAETKDDLLTSVYDAAMRCINSRFDAVHIDLLDRQLNVRIFEGVVKPLWENCRF